jgi:hypothetical protein
MTASQAMRNSNGTPQRVSIVTGTTSFVKAGPNSCSEAGWGIRRHGFVAITTTQEPQPDCYMPESGFFGDGFDAPYGIVLGIIAICSDIVPGIL